MDERAHKLEEACVVGRTTDGRSSRISRFDR